MTESVDTSMVVRRNIKIGSLVTFFVLVALFVPLAMSVQTTSDAGTALIPKNDENALRYQSYLSQFPNDFTAVIHLSGLACSDAGWKLAMDIEQAANSLDMVYRTVSVASAKYVSSFRGELDVQDFSEKQFASAQERCNAAANYAPFRNILIESASKNLAIYLIAKEGYLNAIEFTKALRALVEPFENKISTLGGELNLAGEPVISAELSEQTNRASSILLLVCITMFMVVWLITRSLPVAALAIANGFFSVLATFGTMGLLNIELTPITSIVGNLLFPLAAAFTIHAHGYLIRSTNFIHGIIPDTAIKPFLFATLTTMIGFGTTSFSDSPDVQKLGFLGIVGIVACCISVFILVFPALTRLRATEPASPATNLDGKANNTPNITLAAALVLIFLAVSLFGLSRLEVNFSPNDYLKHSNTVRQGYETVARDFGRYTIPMLVAMPGDEGALQPEPWLASKDFVDDIKQQYPGTNVSWFHTQLSEITYAFLLEDDAEFPDAVRPFPETRAQISQFLLWFDEDDIESFLDEDRSQFTILFQTPLEGSKAFVELENQVEDFANQSGLEANLVGRIANNFRIGHQVGVDNLYGVLLGMALIFLVFLFMLKSISLSLIGVLVNGLPVLACLGSLALLGIPLDLGSSIVASICLGIAVDDTSHYLMRYQVIKSTKQCDSKTAANLTSKELARPIITTTLAIVIGFLWMNMADMVPLQTFSRILSIALLVGLSADLWILPALVTRFDKFSQ